MKRTSLPLTALLAATVWVALASAQQPPAAQPGYSGKGTVKAFNSGPNGEINGIILSDGAVVFFPSATGEPIRVSIKEGSQVTFNGVSRPAASNNRLIVDAQTITANGQTFTAATVPPPLAGGPGAPSGRGRSGRGPGQALAGGPPPPPPG